MPAVIIVAVALLFTARSPHARAQDRPAAEPRPAIEVMDDALEAIRIRHGAPALVAALLRDGELVLRGVSGTRTASGRAPIAPDDRFHIGSCTKAMTATLAAILVEDGLIRWETTIAERLPDMADEIEPAYRDVTLEQLLAHLSGLPDDRSPDRRVWPRVIALEGPIVEQRVALARIALKQKPVAKAGAEHHYSNFGYTIAACMLEQAVGRSWEELMRERIFDPLGMSSAGFGAPGAASVPGGGAAAMEAAQPCGHTVAGDVLTPVPPGPRADNPAVIAPAGGVHCSLDDWGKFLAAHLAGVAGEPSLSLKPESFEKLHTPPPGQEYALGWIVARRPWAGGVALTHAGSNGLWFAVVWLAPEKGMAIVAATNFAGAGAFPACDEAIAALIQRAGGN